MNNKHTVENEERKYVPGDYYKKYLEDIETDRQIGRFSLSTNRVIAYSVGAAPTCDILLPYTIADVPRHAFDLIKIGDEWYYDIKDLRVAGRNHLNDNAIIELGAVKIQAKLEDGRWRFTVFPENRKAEYSIAVKNVCYSPKKKWKILNVKNTKPNSIQQILHNISLYIPPGSLVALYGGSGVGKTTLLRIMRGEILPSDISVTSGLTSLDVRDDSLPNEWTNAVLNDKAQITHGGKDINQQNSKGKIYKIGYVPQRDIVPKELTVEEALDYSHRIRNPKISKNVSRNDVERVIALLQLEKCRNNKIEGKTTISGGERRRVNIAMELIERPMVMFMDEPLSGLDDSNARIIMNIMKDISREGRIVIMTTHHTKRDLFELFDYVCFLGKYNGYKSVLGAGVAYYGPAKEAVTYFRNHVKKLDDYLNRFNEEKDEAINSICSSYDFKKEDIARTPIIKYIKADQPSDILDILAINGSYWNILFQQTKECNRYVLSRLSAE